ncbi:hypothetical protein TGAM01_v209670 [Trichoderma gamsii]|uniref:Uncharacterized protein n=1 Tax=Trichoderma gamsii TaxID=398673 RepID=A0A2P4ZB58_9HYPO|nr:hypothetical protein TGAM01_v209670 [Trichoderma gamsii]PON21507.1 hypothetical protein TGAM01_v209670 [Trichoderma gamsii]
MAHFLPLSPFFHYGTHTRLASYSFQKYDKAFSTQTCNRSRA